MDLDSGRWGLQSNPRQLTEQRQLQDDRDQIFRGTTSLHHGKGTIEQKWAPVQTREKDPVGPEHAGMVLEERSQQQE